MRRFEFVGGNSNKFWEIEQSGSEVTVHFGRIGTMGQFQTKDLDSWDAAAERVRKLVAEKLREGYKEVGGPAFPADPNRGYRPPPDLPPYEPADLPENGPVGVGDVSLPEGRRLEGNPELAIRGAQIVSAPVVWATNDKVPNSGRLLYALRQAIAARGVVPVMLTGLPEDPSRPWDSREFAPTDPRVVDSLDAEAELAHMWHGCFEDPDEEEEHSDILPFNTDFPGLAAAAGVAPPRGFQRILTKLRDPSDDTEALEKMGGRRLALVAASRPADIIAALGWFGAVNVNTDVAAMSAVLRSWEDRFRARVVEVGFDTLTLTVGLPPPDQSAALAIAAEHFAFCPDNIWQGARTIRYYARALVRNPTWVFWWD